MASTYYSLSTGLRVSNLLLFQVSHVQQMETGQSVRKLSFVSYGSQKPTHCRLHGLDSSIRLSLWERVGGQIDKKVDKDMRQNKILNISHAKRQIWLLTF